GWVKGITHPCVLSLLLLILLIAGFIFIIEQGMSAAEVDFTTLDIHLFHLAGQFKWIACGDNESRILTGFQRTHLILHAEYLCGIESEGFQGFLCGQTMCGCCSRLVNQIPYIHYTSWSGR